MIKEIVSKNSFKQDFKKATKQGFIKEAEIAEIDKIIQLLANNQPLEPRHRNHFLKHDYAGFSECHIKPNLLLIYKVEADILYLTRIGRHQDIFKKY